MLDKIGMRWTPLAALALAVALPASAHDVWMQSDRFAIPIGATLNYRIFVGHGAAREAWNVSLAKVVALRSITASSDLILKPTKSDEGAVRFARAGTYIIGMTSNNSVSDLPSLRFNEYAASEGLTPILSLRERLKQTQDNGRELYSRRTKMLVKVGVGRTPQPHILRPIGLTLELVPQRDPFLIPAGAPLPLQVFYLGRPLAGATVKFNDLDADAKPVSQAITDRNGVVRFRQPGPGRWQVNVVWARPLVGHHDADFETIFSSLTFGS